MRGMKKSLLFILGASAVFAGGLVMHRRLSPVVPVQAEQAMRIDGAGGQADSTVTGGTVRGGAVTGTARVGYRGKWAEFTFEDIEGKDDRALMDTLKLEGIDLSAVRALRRTMRVVYSPADREAKLEAVRALRAELGVELDISGIAADSTVEKGPMGLALRMGGKAKGILASIRDAFTRYYDALLHEFRG